MINSNWWYLSFAEGKFLGGCIVKATGLLDAVDMAHLLKINPGGEVFGFEIPKGKIPDLIYMNRLLTKEEISTFWPDSIRLGDYIKKKAN